MGIKSGSESDSPVEMFSVEACLETVFPVFLRLYGNIYLVQVMKCEEQISNYLRRKLFLD